MKTLVDVVSADSKADNQRYQTEIRPKSTANGSGSKHGRRSSGCNFDEIKPYNIRYMDTSKYMATNMREYLSKNDEPVTYESITFQDGIKDKLNKNRMLQYKYQSNMKSSYNQYYN